LDAVHTRARHSSPALLFQDEPAQVGKDQEIKVMKEMNELQQFENEIWSPGRE
jgi:hypothetical protein